MDGTGYVVGIDGGGTHTLCLVATRDGRVLGQGEGGPANLYSVGMEITCASVADALADALTDAGLAHAQVVAMTAGLSGTHVAADAALLRGQLAGLVPNGVTTIRNDGEVALAAATGGGRGMVVVAGTGSIGFGGDGQGRVVRSGGWGYLIGDEGSAFAIARAGLAVGSAAVDGRGTPSLLAAALPQALGVADFDATLPVIYGPPPLTRQQIADLARVVTQCAARGDAASLAILAQAGADLARLVWAMGNALDLPTDAAFPVAGNGGVFRAGPLVLQPFTQAVRQRYPGARVSLPLLTAAAGAAVLALRDLADPAPWTARRAAILANLAATHAYPTVPDVPPFDRALIV